MTLSGFREAHTPGDFRKVLGENLVDKFLESFRLVCQELTDFTQSQTACSTQRSNFQQIKHVGSFQWAVIEAQLGKTPKLMTSQ